MKANKKFFVILAVVIAMLTSCFALSACDDEPADQPTVTYDDITVDDITESFVYNGKEFYPEVTVKKGEVVLKKGKHYTLEYKDNINAGEGSVTVYFKGDYLAVKPVEKKFTIGKIELTADMITLSCSQKTNGVGSFSAVAKCGDIVSGEGELSVSVTNRFYTGEGVATITAGEDGNFTGTVEKPYVMAAYEGASARVMNAELDAIDDYEGEAYSVTAMVEGDCRGLWYKAEMHEDGLYIVAKAVADNYINDNTYAAGSAAPAAQATRYTYFEFYIEGAKTQVFTYGGGGVFNDKEVEKLPFVETRQAGAKIFDFVVWRTVENESEQSGKYTHICEGFVSKDKLTTSYAGVAYSSAFNPNPVYDEDGTTVILPRGHIEKLKPNAGAVEGNADDIGLIYPLPLNGNLANRMTVGGNGIVFKSASMGTKTDDGSASDGGAKNENAFTWTNTAENFVAVITYTWDADFAFANNGGVWSCTDYSEITSGSTAALALTCNMSGSPSLMLNLDFKSTGITSNPFPATGGATGTLSGDAMAIAAKSVELLRAGEWRVVFVREGDTCKLYAPTSTTGDLVLICTNPIAYNAQYKGFIFRKRPHRNPVTATGIVIRGTVDYERVLEAYVD